MRREALESGVEMKKTYGKRMDEIKEELEKKASELQKHQNKERELQN